MDIEGARETYLKMLGQALKSHDARIVAYCLMSSHIHLVVQVGCDPIGKLTKKIHSPFGNWVNAQRRGIGPIFADRPKSVLVHDETYGMELIRYVHNNPVRAGVVERASESSWSSHRAYLGLAPMPEWLSTEAVFGSDEKKREAIRQELSIYVDEGKGEGRRPEFSGEVSRELSKRVRKMMGGEVELSYPVLGPDAFVSASLKEQVKRHRDKSGWVGTEGGAKELVTAVFEMMSIDPRTASQRVKPMRVARGRALAAWLWVERLGRPQSMVAEEMKVRSNAVSKMLTKLRAEGLTNEEESMLDRVSKKLAKGKAVANRQKENSPQSVVLKRKR